MFKFLKNSKKESANDSGKSQPKLNFLQRAAMKKLEKMTPQERDTMIQDAMKPENREKLIEAIEKMQSSGMVSKSQIEKAKKQIGL